MCISTLKMSKPDLKGKNNEDYPMVRIRFECDRRVTVLPHTFNSSSYKPFSKNRLMIAN
jgi:hypothetical protein